MIQSKMVAPNRKVQKHAYITCHDDILRQCSKGWWEGKQGTQALNDLAGSLVHSISQTERQANIQAFSQHWLCTTPLSTARILQELTKHSAASSMKPSWKRCSSLKASANALRRLCEGKACSLLCWNWEKMPWRDNRRDACTWTTGRFVYSTMSRWIGRVTASLYL